MHFAFKLLLIETHLGATFKSYAANSQYNYALPK